MILSPLPKTSRNFEKKHSSNISGNETKAFNALKNDKTIVIKEADKGGGIVIMNKDFYKNKIEEMLQDDTLYKTAKDACLKKHF